MQKYNNYHALQMASMREMRHDLKCEQNIAQKTGWAQHVAIQYIHS